MNNKTEGYWPKAQLPASELVKTGMWIACNSRPPLSKRQYCASGVLVLQDNFFNPTEDSLARLSQFSLDLPSSEGFTGGVTCRRVLDKQIQWRCHAHTLSACRLHTPCAASSAAEQCNIQGWTIPRKVWSSRQELYCLCHNPGRCACLQCESCSASQVINLEGGVR